MKTKTDWRTLPRKRSKHPGLYQRTLGGRSVWCLDYTTEDGTRIRKAVGSRAAAERELNIAKGEVERGTHGDPRVTFGDWIDGAKWKNRPTPDSQREWDSSAIPRYFLDTLRNVPLAKITDGDLESLQARIRKMPGQVGETLAPATVNRAMKTLRLVLRHAKKHRILAALPEFPKPESKAENPDPLSEAERKALLSAFDNRAGFLRTLGSEARGKRAEPAWIGFQRFKLAVALALETGLTKGDLIGLRWKHVGPKSIEGKRNKTGEPYSVPLTDDARAVLKACKAGRDVHPEAFVLINGEGLAWDSSRVNRQFKKALRIAGIKRRFRFHDLRHTFGYRLKSGGVSDAGIRTLMGWAEDSGMVYHYGGTPDTRQIFAEALEALKA